MFNSLTPPKTITASPSVLTAEGWLAQQRRELQETNQLALEEEKELQSESNKLESGDSADSDAKELINSNNSSNQPSLKLNILEALELITDKITALPTFEYLPARSEFMQILKICLKRLEKHEEKTFIPLLEAEPNRTLRLGKYAVTYKPSQKTVIDENKLKQALPNPEQFKFFLKPAEFKNMQECKTLLLKLRVFSDVFATKLGKKPILHISDTNTLKREIENQEEEIEQN